MKINFRAARHSPEFTSAIIRYGFWLVSTLFIGFAMWTHYYEPIWDFYIYFSLGFLLYSSTVFVSVLYWARVWWRPYLTILFDVAAISIAMLFTEDGPFSPFFLFYAWYFVSYALRYGRGPLLAATLCSLLAFAIVLTLTDTWYYHVYDVIAYYVFLIIMPLYLDMMLRRLKSARDEANRANKAKSEFLAAMSHEIRTPMSGIVGVTSLLDQTELNHDQREYVSALQESSTALNALIDDVLDLSKIEAGKYQLQEEQVNLPKTLFGVAQMFTASANAKGLEVFFDYDTSLPDYIYGDGKRLRQIVLNLVSNAVKFTARGEVILRVLPTAQAQPADRMVIRIEVQDTGPGLSKEQRQQIFEPFYQVGGAHNQEQTGTGLGTAIAANLVKLMHGKIGVDSEVGKGSTFWIEIPWRCEAAREIDSSLLSGNHPLVIYETHKTNAAILKKYCDGLHWEYLLAAQQDELLAHLKQAVNDECKPVVLLSELTCGENCGQLAVKLHSLYGDKIKICKLLHLAKLHEISVSERDVYAQFLTLPVTAHRLLKMLQVVLTSKTPESEEKPFGTTTISRFLNILVAEDSAINAKVITTFLQQDGHRVEHVINGRLALDALAQHQYDLVLMDMRMPEVDGLEATRQWRARETDGRHVPIVALTANATTEDKNTCLAAGMDEFLSKPVNQEQLRSLIRSLG
ncbi:MAG: response regulator [Gammaproteobacteria bacterium]|nr:response regulator [Gammaproteobacteria bacterium]